MAKSNSNGQVVTNTPTIPSAIQSRSNKAGTSSGTPYAGKMPSATTLAGECVKSFMPIVKKMKP